MLDEPKERETPPEDTALPEPSPETKLASAEMSDGEPQGPRLDEALVTPSSEVYSSSSDPYGHLEPAVIPAAAQTQEITGYMTPEAVAQIPPRQTPPPPPPPPPADEEDEGNDEERGMLRMSFMEHLEELRSRLLRAIGGLIVAFILSIGFCQELWNIVSAPAVTALRHLGINPPNLTAITPMEQFNVIYLKLPLLVSVFVGSPWIFYQVWAFISPGLYKREKKWAVPFILCTAGLFITGGSFAYFVAFRYGLEFLLGIGRNVHVTPFVSINEYFDLFVNVTLGVGLVFEMPVIIFFLTLLRLASPRFLLRHSRYAILAITVIAAVVTPTPDIFNMMLFAVPMVLLFFVGLFAAYLLVLKREGKKFPWGKILLGVLAFLILIGGVVALLIYHFHFHAVPKWPYLLPPIRPGK
ncbi:MAG: twin-arginine translocase subunit TatC [Acidobacteriota bacterium]|nr:twin-arginine translocase subunit TatC [Acidobacteriota bacterium]